MAAPPKSKPAAATVKSNFFSIEVLRHVSPNRLCQFISMKWDFAAISYLRKTVVFHKRYCQVVDLRSVYGATPVISLRLTSQNKAPRARSGGPQNLLGNRRA